MKKNLHVVKGFPNVFQEKFFMVAIGIMSTKRWVCKSMQRETIDKQVSFSGHTCALHLTVRKELINQAGGDFHQNMTRPSSLMLLDQEWNFFSHTAFRDKFIWLEGKES